MSEEIVFGPVPSRRLGMSLGVNNVFSKYCTYSCIYCQVGRTDHLIIERRAFYEPHKLANMVVKAFYERKPDVVTFVPNGEPTLDVNLGKEAVLIKQRSNARLAILTNSSLIYRDDVMNDLFNFDIVSVKVDAVDEKTWRKINRPHPKLSLDRILNSIIEFSKDFQKTLIAEIMLVENVNDKPLEAENLARYLKELKNLSKAYIMVPVRPPAEQWVLPPAEERILEVYTILSRELGKEKVELLVNPEPPKFKFLDDLEEEILRTINVHPLRLSYVIKIAENKGRDPESLIRKLLSSKRVKLVDFSGEKFLVPKTRK